MSRLYKYILNEGFTFLPKSINEFSKKIPLEFIENLTSAFEYVSKISSIEDPFAIDTTKTNKKLEIKVTRKGINNVQDIVKKLNSMYSNLSFSVGNGTRGNRGSSNRGLGFEKDVIKELENISNGIDNYNALATKLTKITDTFGDEDWTIEHEGALNKKRGPIWNGKRLQVNNGQTNIGHIISDITIKSKSKKEYLSIKHDGSGRINYANLGCKKFFPPSMFADNAPINKDAIPILKWFGINDYDRFIKVFRQENDKEIIETTSLPFGWKEFIQESIGCGYWKVTPNNVIYYTPSIMSSLSKATQLTVKYSKSPSKTLFVNVNTIPQINVEIRNTHGGVIPEMIIIYQKTK